MCLLVLQALHTYVSAAPCTRIQEGVRGLMVRQAETASERRSHARCLSAAEVESQTSTSGTEPCLARLSALGERCARGQPDPRNLGLVEGMGHHLVFLLPSSLRASTVSMKDCSPTRTWCQGPLKHDRHLSGIHPTILPHRHEQGTRRLG